MAGQQADSNRSWYNKPLGGTLLPAHGLAQSPEILHVAGGLTPRVTATAPSTDPKTLLESRRPPLYPRDHTLPPLRHIAPGQVTPAG